MSRIIVIWIPLLVLLMLSVWGILGLFNQLRRNRFQYSLRTLLIFVTAVAVLLSAITTWNQWSKAQIEFLDPASPIVAAWNAPPVITEEKGDFKAVYQTQCLSADEIYKIARKAMDQGRIHGITSYNLEGTIIVRASNREKLVETLAAMRKADVVLPGRFVIRGLVKDSAGDPLSGARIDLTGPYAPFNNFFQSRKDGTFSIPITAPAQSGYYLRISYGKKAMDSTTFSLDSTRPEMFVEVRVW